MIETGPTLLLVSILERISSPNKEVRAGPVKAEISRRLEAHQEGANSKILTSNETLFVLLAKELRNGVREERIAGLALLLRERGLPDEKILEGAICFLSTDQQTVDKIHQGFFSG
ncbi:MAG TPA: hypothetical protein ENI16_00900 [Candidatus Portnoybacteria bacterium]|nr:hypothetical protein [Candidatus Portnoybacteria bacterium]